MELRCNSLGRWISEVSGVRLKSADQLSKPPAPPHLAGERFGGTISASRRQGGGSSLCSPWSLNHVARGSVMRRLDTLALVRDALALEVDCVPRDTLDAPIVHVGHSTLARGPDAGAAVPGLCACTEQAGWEI